MEIRIVEHYSKDYWKLVRLRDKLLREPLNLMFSEEELFLESDQIHLGCFENEVAIGSLSFVKKEDSSLKMRQVCVSQEQQGKNIGKEIILFAEKWAKDNQFSNIECNARENAIPFYESCGYDKVGDEFFEVKISHFKMTKALV